MRASSFGINIRPINILPQEPCVHGMFSIALNNSIGTRDLAHPKEHDFLLKAGWFGKQAQKVQ